ncbi:methyltransferase type 12 [Sphingomonas sp. MM-1]|uniref:class I SAM-dependent methyltransferase n=1 Tax=Sphingomonas sp. MM-1 TaxID=745310 RepID=UPI0002C08042|nr:class I SAM-dependent methyltransferase [Sphingomonas sp. MM-1]AGH48791.1 methyltransferase type 12 [Sphingomonas sp. MM-1]
MADNAHAHAHAHAHGNAGARHFLDAFRDPQAIAHYAEGPRRFVPGIDALHRMTALLLAESAPADARVLVLGAGGGLELKVLAEAQPGWTFVGVDPAGPMLDLAVQTLGPLADRVQWVEGYIDDAPAGPFDAATCLLTLHFLDAPERLRTVAEIHRRLKPGAPFVAAHGSFPQDATRSTWLERYAAYAVASGADPQQAGQAKAAVAANLSLLDPERDEAILKEAGFADAALFYAAFTWRGWIGHAEF